MQRIRGRKLADVSHRLNKLLIIQIPCFNEENTLAETLADLPREVIGFDRVEWLVIDDGSNDRTVEVALKNGVDHVISHPRNLGLAAAFSTGIKACLDLGADVIVNTDADNQYQGSCVSEITQPIVNGEADLVVGERPIDRIKDFSRSKKYLQKLGSQVVRSLSGTPVRDAASGFRAISRLAASKLKVYGTYSYTMETLIQAGSERLLVMSIPIEVNPKTRDSRLVKSSFRYVLRSGTTILRAFLLYKPFKFFFSFGSVFFLFGSALLLRWAYQFTSSDALHLVNLLIAVSFLLVSLQLWLFALIADLFALNRKLISESLMEIKAIREKF